MSVSREEAQRAKAKARATGEHGPKPNGAASPPASILRADNIGARPVPWTWHPYLPASQIALLGAPGGGGKGLNGTEYAACVTTGRAWPGGTERAPSGHVLWCEAEDPLAEVLVPRLIAAGADLSKVEFASRQAFADLGDGLGEFIRSRPVRLIIMSPLISFLQGLADINGELGVRDVLERLQGCLDGTGCSVLGLAHTNKKPDLRAIERLLGSVAFANFVRSVLLVGRDQDEPDWFRLVHAKHNLSIKGDDLLYRPVHVGEDPRDQFVKLEWKRPETNVDADRLFDRRKAQADIGPSARDWLIDYLKEHGESLRAEIVIAGEEAGFKEETIRKAQSREKKIEWRRDGFQGPIWWSLT